MEVLSKFILLLTIGAQIMLAKKKKVTFPSWVSSNIVFILFIILNEYAWYLTLTYTAYTITYIVCIVVKKTKNN